MTTEHNAIHVGIDAETLEVISYLDGRHTNPSMTNVNPQLSNDDISKIATQFIEKLESIGSNPIPASAQYSGLYIDERGYHLNWIHTLNDVEVTDDFISLSISKTSGQIYSYSKCWHSFTIDTIPKVSISDTLNLIEEQIVDDVDFTIINNLCIVGHNSDNFNKYTPRLVWRISLNFDGDGVAEFLVDANTGKIYDSSVSLDIYEDVFVYDIGYSASYECAIDVYHRLEYATEWYARYYEDKDDSYVLSKLVYERAFYNLGHGSYGSSGSEMQTYLITDDGNIWPDDVTSKDLSGMYLAFLCSCYSAADDYPVLWWREDIDTSIADAFLDAGAQCVFGWDEAVLKVDAYDFSRYFFDYVTNGYDFGSCYDYAYSKVDAECRAIARIYGDTDLYLDEEDGGSDSSPGTSLGSGYDVTFTKSDEGLWYPDVDWFYFTVSGYRQVSILVAPNDDLDVAFYVYNEYMQTVIYRDSYGSGHSEYGVFMGNGQTYHIYIYQSDSHGGYYDLSVNISS